MRLRGRLSRLAPPPGAAPPAFEIGEHGGDVEPETLARFGEVNTDDAFEAVVEPLPPACFDDADHARRASPWEARGRGPSPSEKQPRPTDILAELRTRITRVLERAPIEKFRPPPVDLPELPFVQEDTPRGPLHVRARRLSAAHRVGHVGVHSARTASPDVLALLALDAGLAGCSPERALYLDTETTGLSGGTGTVAFLVGLAFFEPAAPGDVSGSSGAWIVEQLLVRELGEEAPMLERVAQRLAAAEMIVTFNGKSFDMPLLRTRFVLAGLPLPPEPAHLDLVHVARRLHKARGVPCKLTKLEEHVLGFVRVDDVPSGEVAGHYLHFLRTGDTRGLVGVVDHNGWDVESMIALVALYGEPLDDTRLVATDLVGVARTLRRADRLTEALELAERAVVAGAGPSGLRVRAELKKARGDREAALLDFESLAAQIDCPKTRLELAKLYEHVRKAPARALAVLEGGTEEKAPLAEKRRARLEKKVAKNALVAHDDGPLFHGRGATKR